MIRAPRSLSTTTNQSRSTPTMSTPMTARRRVWSRQSRKRMTTMARDIFERLDKGRPPTEAPPSPEIIRMGPAAATIPPAGPKAHPTEKLLSWLLNYSPKPTISLREICRFGPRGAGARDWEGAMDLAETLVQRGWFIPRETQRRRDMRVWQILRGPNK